MKKIYIATGYNSWANKELHRAFTTEQEADQFINGLTDPRLVVMSYNSTVQLANALLGNQEITA
jgi:hypothetical protein